MRVDGAATAIDTEALGPLSEAHRREGANRS